MKLSLYSQILNKKHLKLGTQFWYLASSMNGPWLNRLPLPVHKHFSLTVSEDIAVCVCVCVCVVWACACAQSLQPYSILCDPMDYSPPGSSVHGILQARILKWVAISSSRGSSRPRDWTHVFYVCLRGRWVITSATWKAPRIQQYISYIISSTGLDHRVTHIVGGVKQQFGYGS